MGYLGALGMAQAAPLDAALSWHFTSNHFPPLPTSLIPVAKRAIKAAQAGEWDRKLRLPTGMSWKGQRNAPVSACVEAWHLNAFIDNQEGDDELSEQASHYHP